jgi:hypothetical protein
MSTETSPVTAIDRLVIESEINRLLATYVHNLDDGKIEENAKLLAEIDRFFRSNVQHHEDGTPRTWHALSNILIDVESATSAKALSYFTVHQALDGLPLQPIVAGRYVDAFEQRDGRWRFISREVQPRLFGDVSKHVAAPANASAE